MGIFKVNDPELEERLIRHNQRKLECKAMTDSQFGAYAEHVLNNSAIPFSRHILLGEPVYDSVLWHIVIPELIKRMKGRA